MRNTFALVLTFATATPALADTVSLGLGYSSLRGALAQADLDMRNILKTGVNLDLAYDQGGHGRGASLALDRSWTLGNTRLGTDSRLFLALNGTDQDWDYMSYSQKHQELLLGAGAHLTANLGYDFGLFVQSDDLAAQTPATTSALILSEMGESSAAGISLGLNFSNRGDGHLAAGSAFRGNLRVAGIGASRDFVQFQVAGDHYVPAWRGSVFDFHVEGGLVQSTSGDHVALIDRAMLGGDAVRGFAYAGLGPHDPTTGDALGGTRYGVATVELFLPTPRDELWASVFLDMGALWRLPGVTGIDDGFALRHSVGVAVNYDLPMGRLSASWAVALDPQAQDAVQNLTLSISTKL